jgi:hypothetical protein
MRRNADFTELPASRVYFAGTMTWKSVDTVRCERCAVFTPTDDILYTTSGTIYCTTCGAPPVSIRPPPPSPIAVSTARFKRSPVAIAFAAVAAIVMSSFIAACASQL